MAIEEKVMTSIRRLFALVLLVFATSATAQVDSLQGPLITHNSRFAVVVEVTSTDFVKFWTTSYLAGGFNPMLSLWWQGHLIDTNDDALNPSIGMGSKDASIYGYFAPSELMIIVSVAGNTPVSNRLEDGFLFDGQAPIPMEEYCPLGECGRGLTATLYWRIGQPDPVVTPPPPAVPEPSSWALMLAGLGVVGAMRRVRRKA